MRGSDCSIENVLSVTAYLSPPHKAFGHTAHSLKQLRCWLDCYYCCYCRCCSQRVSVAHPFLCPSAACTVIHPPSMTFLPAQLLLCSRWRLSTKSNPTTAKMDWMRTLRPPNERIACGKYATRPLCVLVSTAAERCRRADLL